MMSDLLQPSRALVQGLWRQFGETPKKLEKPVHLAFRISEKGGGPDPPYAATPAQRLENFLSNAIPIPDCTRGMIGGSVAFHRSEKRTGEPGIVHRNVEPVAGMTQLRRAFVAGLPQISKHGFLEWALGRPPGASFDLESAAS